MDLQKNENMTKGGLVQSGILAALDSFSIVCIVILKQQVNSIIVQEQHYKRKTTYIRFLYAKIRPFEYTRMVNGRVIPGDNNKSHTDFFFAFLIRLSTYQTLFNGYLIRAILSTEYSAVHNNLIIYAICNSFSIVLY